MEEINFSEFRVKYSAILDQVRKTHQSIRVTRFGEPLAEIVPLSSSEERGASQKVSEKLAAYVKSSPRVLKPVHFRHSMARLSRAFPSLISRLALLLPFR